MEYPFKDLMPLDEVLEREGYYKDWTHLDPEVFYSLTQISEYIKTKGYGVDVRLLIAQLAEHFGLKTTQVVDLGNLLTAKHAALKTQVEQAVSQVNADRSALETQFNQSVAQMEADKNAVIANVTVDSEVILARGGKATLGERLDETTAQLAQTVVLATSPPPPLVPADNTGTTATDIEINNIIKYCDTNNLRLKIPAGTYLMDEPMEVLPSVIIEGEGQRTIIQATSTLRDNHQELINCDREAQNPFYLSNMCFVSGTGLNDNDLNGLHLGGSRNSKFHNLVFVSFGGSAILVYPTNPNSGDVDNPLFDKVWTVQCKNAITFKTNQEINRGNITCATVRDSMLISDDSSTYTEPSTPVKFFQTGDKFLYGVQMERTFLHNRNAPLIYAKGTSPRYFYNIYIRDIDNDTWNNPSGANDFYAVELYNLGESDIENIQVTRQITKGFKLSGCNNIQLKRIGFYDNFRDSTILSGKLGILNIDDTSSNIYVDDIHLDYIKESEDSSAINGYDVFGGNNAMIVDHSGNTVVRSTLFKHEVVLLNSPKKLMNTKQGLLTNYPTSSSNITFSMTPEGYLKAVIPPNATGVFDIPVKRITDSHGVHVEFKITGNTGGVYYVGAFGLNKLLSSDTSNFNALTYIVDTSTGNHDFYSFGTSTPSTTETTILFKKFEVYDGGYLPYAPNYVAIEPPSDSLLGDGVYYNQTAIDEVLKTSIVDTNIVVQTGEIYEIYVSANPNSAGHHSYNASNIIRVICSGDYTTTVVKKLNVEEVSRVGGGQGKYLDVEATFINNGSESTTIPTDGVGLLRIKVMGYTTSVGANQKVRIKRVL